MAQVTVNIGGRSYRLACNPGEEPHLEALASALDGKIAEMRESFGEIGDQRLAIMAALTIADDASEANRRLTAANARADSAETSAREAREEADRISRTMTDALNEMCAKVEALTAALGGAASSG
jgi:cell division protein ZapA